MNAYVQDEMALKLDFPSQTKRSGKLSPQYILETFFF